MLLPLGVSLLALLSHPQSQIDPEQSPAGRARYLGREVAHTMHWRGATWLLRATREDEENGEFLRRWLAVQTGQTVCDLGCGNGYHTLPLAKVVGSAGRVFAVDLQPEMLTLLQKRLNDAHLSNVTLVEATVDDPKLPPASCDLVLMVDVYHELSHPVRVMARLQRALKPDGRVVLVEFRAEDPAVPIKAEHKMTKAQIVRELAAGGFGLVDAFDGLPWQHAMAFAPLAAGPRLAPRELLRNFLMAAGSGDSGVIAPFLVAGLSPEDLPPLAGDLRAELRAGPDGRLLATLCTAAGDPLPHDRDEVVLACDGDGRWSVEAVRRRQAFVHVHGARRPFVAMQTATGGGPLDDRTELVCELGFDGLAWDLDQLAGVRRACESRGTDLISAYAVLDLGDGFAERLAPVRAALQAMEGGPGMVWLALQHAGSRARDVAGDDVAVQALTELLRDADAAGIEIALYPHSGFWLETVDDALRLCARIDHPRLGVCFNLCHFLRNGDDPDAAPLLRRCGERLFAVTVNGADLDGSDWHTLIRPLGEGTFDLTAFLTILDELGFVGPVGLQGFGIERPAREHLAQSMKAWRAAQAR